MLEIAVQFIFPDSARLLPNLDWSDRARALLAAIGLQESGFRQRKQINGPARSFWQFELTGVSALLRHRSSRAYLEELARQLCYEPDPLVIWTAIEHNDLLACCCARLLLATDPRALPERSDADAGWQIYLDCWRPGRPRRWDWDSSWNRAWSFFDAR